MYMFDTWASGDSTTLLCPAGEGDDPFPSRVSPRSFSEGINDSTPRHSSVGADEFRRKSTSLTLYCISRSFSIALKSACLVRKDVYAVAEREGEQLAPVNLAWVLLSKAVNTEEGYGGHRGDHILYEV